MFSAFSRRLPQISVFHHPAVPASVSALALLRAALAAPGAPPLEFNLEVVESRPPTPDQLRTILAYLAPAPASYAAFLAQAHDGPATAAGVAELAAQNPSALKWPIVVDWHGGRAAVGDLDGVARILEALRQRRDGEVKEDVVQPRGWFW